MRMINVDVETKLFQYSALRSDDFILQARVSFVDLKLRWLPAVRESGPEEQPIGRLEDDWWGED